MKLLACDIGTTHCKAGLFEMDGAACRIAARPMPVRRDADGRSTLDPDQLGQTVVAVLAEAAAATAGDRIAAVGIASMAETGLLVDARTSQPRSELIPWFDRGAASQAAQINAQEDPFAIFQRSGLRASYKCGLAKLLWLRQRTPQITEGAVWLSAADFVAHRLTGQRATDPTLAARTLAYRLEVGDWDAAWLAGFGLHPDLFPPVTPSGQIMGQITRAAAVATGLPVDTPVAICGHDHVCAALATGAIEPGIILDSIGTAESLLGALPARPLTRDDFAAGLSFGPHVAPGRMYWMAGLSAAGGSLDWLRGQLGDPPISYASVSTLLAAADLEPVDLLYFPYLLGAQAPWPDPAARGAFVGLTAAHTRSDLLKAVLQGTAYEMACAQQAAERTTGSTVRVIEAVGGGARVPAWLQIKADVTGRQIRVPEQTEATLLGAAILAGIGAGIYDDHRGTAPFSSAAHAIAHSAAASYLPDPMRHQTHLGLLALYQAIQAPLRQASANLSAPTHRKVV